MRLTASLVAGGVALITGALVLWTVFGGVPESGSGGLGAVSAGISDAILLFALLASVIANRLFARPASVRGGIVKHVHRVQSVALLLLVVTIAAMFATGSANPHTGLWYVLIATALFAGQLLLIGVVVALLVLSPPPAAAAR